MQIAPFMKHKVLVYSDKEQKQEVVAKWLKEGGVLLGAGLTTGIDLKYDLCRLNIISKIPFPNLGDVNVAKRMALDPKWYPMSAAKQVIQACGRSTRSEDDYSVSVIIDNRWSQLYHSVKDTVPQFFKEVVDLRVVEI
jgi:Rad3-related DNA helicase